MAEDSRLAELMEINALLHSIKSQGALEPGDLVRVVFKKNGFPGVVALNALVISGYASMANGDLIVLQAVMDSGEWTGALDRVFVFKATSTFRKRMFDATVRPYLEEWRRFIKSPETKADSGNGQRSSSSASASS